MSILIDTGSTHSFIDKSLVNSVGLVAEVIPPLIVTVADGSRVLVDTACKGCSYKVQGHEFDTDLRLFSLGGSDIVLGVDWLKQHNPVTFDFQKFHMTISKGGKNITLKGETQEGSLKTVSCKKLKKLLTHGKNISQGFLCMIQAQQGETKANSQSMAPKELQPLLESYQDIFREPKGLPPYRLQDHKIPLIAGSQPVNQRGYKVPYIQKTEIENQVKEMLQSGIIQASTSPFASPVILVKKKDGSWRMCVDYRKLNDITVKNKYPIPIIDELLDELRGASWFTKLDLRAGYHQIRVAEEDIYKTAFRTHQGLYEFKVMPFGLTNAPASFQALMNEIFQGQIRKSVLVFFDDILVYSSGLQEHLQHLEMVFQKMRDHQLYIKASKCSFGQTQLEYLGHIISREGVATDPEKVAAMTNWPTPTTVKQLRGFLGLTGYYRRFVKGYGQISRPLTNLLKKGSFDWTQEAQGAFDHLKTAMTTTPVLALPDYSQPFVIETDASGNGIGVVLMQMGRPIAYLSKGLATKHQALSTYEKELLAIVMATQKWHSYLQGHHFVIRTDHQSLKYLLEQRLNTLLQQKWLAKLMGLDYEISYKKGKENLVADALSRVNPLPEEGELKEILTVQQGWLVEVLDSYTNDPEVQSILEGIAVKDPTYKLYQYAKGLIKVEGRMYIGSGGDLRTRIIWEFHDSSMGGHSGQEVTYKKISQFFFWPNLRKHVNEYVQNCDMCQRIKSGTQFPGGLLQPLPIPTSIWEEISLDFIEGLPKSSDMDCILVVVDRLTKVGHFIPLKHPYTATTVAQVFLDNVYKLHGMPKVIVSDRDRLFTSTFWKELFAAVGTKLNLSTSYHPQSDGQTERLNRCVEQYLRAMVSSRPKQWCKWLPLAEWWYNTSYNSAIKMSPYEALYGEKPRQLCMPADCRTSVGVVEEFQLNREAMNQLLKDAIQLAQNKYKMYADKKRREVEYQVGDWVFLKLKPYRQSSVAVRRFLKLAHKFFGPYQIIAKVGSVAYKLSLPAGSLVHPVFHVSLLKKKVGSKYSVATTLPKLGREGQFLVYPVKVLDRRVIKKGNRPFAQWLIQWSHSIPEDASWEDAHALTEQFPDFDP